MKHALGVMGRKVAEVWRSLGGLLGGVLGSDAYERYVERHRLEHPDHAPMTERAFWRDRADEAEHNVEGRCC